MHLGQPDQAMAVGGELWRQGMRLGAIEHIGDRLAFIRGQGGDVDQRLDFLAAGRGDDRAGIGMADQNDRAFDPLQRPVERRESSAREVSGSGAATTSTPSA